MCRTASPTPWCSPHVLQFNLPAAEALYAELAEIVKPGLRDDFAGRTRARLHR